MFERTRRDVERRLSGCRRKERGVGLRRNGAQLLDRRRAVDVGRDEQHLLLALRQQPSGELAGGGRLARALQAGQQDHRRRLRRQTEVALRFRKIAADQQRELALHDADQRLPGRQAADDFLAERLLLDARDEVAHHGKRDVGFEQGHAHLAQHVLHVLLGESSLAAHGLDDARQLGGQLFQHGLAEGGSCGRVV